MNEHYIREVWPKDRPEPVVISRFRVPERKWRESHSEVWLRFLHAEAHVVALTHEFTEAEIQDLEDLETLSGNFFENCADEIRRKRKAGRLRWFWKWYSAHERPKVHITDETHFYRSLIYWIRNERIRSTWPSEKL